MNILVTGGAGFIGSHTVRALLDRGDAVVCVDDFNDYYDVSLKEARIQDFIRHPAFTLYRQDICNAIEMEKIFKTHKINKICHLAARAGVRYSIENPLIYEKTNGYGTLVLLEMARKYKVQNFIFASSSSVYGGNTKIPFSEEDPVEKPLAPYAATKRGCELMAYTYHHLYQLPVSALRFFTVYGPWGRPDMSLFKFTKAILNKESIDVYNHGKMKRDFTYVEDIVNGILSAMDTASSYEIFNLGNSHPSDLEYVIGLLGKELGMKIEKNYMDLQPGDVPNTYADISKAQRLLGFEPKTSIEEGIKHFVSWYKNYYKI